MFQLVITPILEKEYSPEKFLEQVTDGNINEETDTGNPLGKEVW